MEDIVSRRSDVIAVHGLDPDGLDHELAMIVASMCLRNHPADVAVRVRNYINRLAPGGKFVCVDNASPEANHKYIHALLEAYAEQGFIENLTVEEVNYEDRVRIVTSFTRTRVTAQAPAIDADVVFAPRRVEYRSASGDVMGSCNVYTRTSIIETPGT